MNSGIGLRTALARYAATTIAVVATVAACWAIGGVAIERPFIPLFFTALLSAVLAGPEYGVVAMLLGALLGAYLFLTPIGALAIDARGDILRLAVFVGACLLSILGVAWIGRRKHSELSNIREQAGETLRESEERYRLLFETSRDGIATIDLDGRFQDANPAYLKMLGYTLDELQTLSFRDVTPERWHETDQKIFGSAFSLTAIPKSTRKNISARMARSFR